MYQTMDGLPIVAREDELSFFHTHKIRVNRGLTPLEAYYQMTQPASIGLQIAFKLRDIISRFAQVKPILGFSSNPATEELKKGDALDFFKIAKISSDALLLDASDKHLKVMLALLIHQDNCHSFLSMTASVKTLNTFGKLYMLPVAPAHKMIVKKMMKKIEIVPSNNR